MINLIEISHTVVEIMQFFDLKMAAIHHLGFVGQVYLEFWTTHKEYLVALSLCNFLPMMQ